MNIAQGLSPKNKHIFQINDPTLNEHFEDTTLI